MATITNQTETKKRENNRDKILRETVSLFNSLGVATSSTNHICRHVGVSPGNLYFHFRDKEAIVRALFDQMCEETYALWHNSFHAAEFLPPVEFIEQSLDIFWRYRFFHREMYHLRRQDPELNRKWHKHLDKTRHFMRAAYAKWVKNGLMIPQNDPQTMRMIADVILVTASSFFQFYESPERPATRKPLQLSKQYLSRFLLPYLRPEHAKAL
jgi:AcrR family transcriptional regulator